MAEALEELTQAIKNIEERLQALNEAKRPNGLARVGTKSAAPEAISRGYFCAGSRKRRSSPLKYRSTF